MYLRKKERRQARLQSACRSSSLGEDCGPVMKFLLSATLLLCLSEPSCALECSGTFSGSLIPSTDVIRDSCSTDGACYVKASYSRFGRRVSHGCLSSADSLSLCNDSKKDGSRLTSQILCCYEDFCNNVETKGDKTLELRRKRESERNKRNMFDVNTTGETMATIGDDNMLKTTVILTAAICMIAMTTIIALVVTVSVCCCYRHGNYRHHSRRRHRQRGDEEIGQSDSRISFASSECCEAIIPSGETLSNLLQSAHHHSSSPSLLVQRSVARHTMMGKTLTQGQFCEVYEGRWRNDRVLVKVYPSKYERLWFTETEIYQISHIPHPSILNFVAAEIIQKNSQTFHHLICEYHERGTLFDHLKTTPIDVHALLVLAESIASGLSHLHSEIHDNQAVMVKPAIAHCNLTSKSIYIKHDGSCCIADLSLAIKDDHSNLTSQLRGRPTTDPRYLAPEFLERHDVEAVDFAALKKADMYSFALVLWEIARRCWIQGLVEEASLPYSDVAPGDQVTLEQMRDIVCVQERRPPLPDQWSMDESMGVVLRLMKECWHPQSEVRLTALRVKKTLHKLDDSVRPLLDKNGKVSMKYEFDREKFHS